MTDIKLFRTTNGIVKQLDGQSVALERSLQRLIETHLEDFFGIRLLASEYATGPTHGGRIDTLGIDENHIPVIIEYKRSTNENVINQGLYCLDWLLDHKAEFTLLVLKKYGQEIADQIEWSSPRLLCIAGDFTKYDEHAVQQINRNIELTRYVRYDDELLLFELVNATEPEIGGSSPGTSTVTERLQRASPQLADVYEEMQSFLTNLGDNVQIKTLKNYVAFHTFQNFACVEIHPQAGKLNVLVKVDPKSIQIEDGFTRDVRDIGHHGTGDLEITIKDRDDLKRAKPLLIESYEIS